MANVDRPNGARPVGTLSGSSWQGHLRTFKVDGSGSDIFPGDFVKMEADGNVDVAAATDVELVGVMVGRTDINSPGQVGGVTGNFLSSSSPDLDRQYYDASVDGASQILVVVGDDVLYEMQEDGAVSQLALADIGSNVEILATAGSDISNQEIDSDSVVATTAQLRLVAFKDAPDNELGVNARWIVKINESHYNKTAGI